MTASHPLEPLSADEIARAVAVARTAPGVSELLRFVSVELREPPKDAYLAWRDDGAPLPEREAFVVFLDQRAARGMEAVVSLAHDTLSAHVVLPADVQPALAGDEYRLAGEVVLADPRYLAALAQRGIHDPATVHVEAWSAGHFEEPGRRLVRAIAWVTEGDERDNEYARPLFGLVALVDLHEMQMLRLDDHAPGTPPPPVSPYASYQDGGGRPYRDDVRPLEITQPEGPSFTVEGNRIRWQRWELSASLHTREGLVLHDVAYSDGGTRRQLCHRASIAELVIPYGDPNPTVHFKNVFDTGEYGLGPLTNSLTLGCDCVGEIRYLDGAVAGIDGTPRVIGNAICIHEEDDNLLWKHTNRFGVVHRARSRRLVISSIATVGNYEYGYFWYLYQDASWEFEAKLTGVVHTAGWPGAERSPYSLPIGEGVVTSGHQHFFCARLDLDVDGPRNVAFQVDAAPDPAGPGNPDGSAFRAHRTTFERESGAKARVAPERARRFRVENTARRNRIGDAVSYELIPGENVAPMQLPDSGIRQRARMLDHQLWVTPYRADERYPAGEYPNQSLPGEGLARWTEADRELLEQDVVLWYVFGSHHEPRLEDWPVMPVARCGFRLRPVGFFDGNPALDVAPPHPHGHHCS
jgi:primary-amine oxidase